MGGEEEVGAVYVLETHNGSISGFLCRNPQETNELEREFAQPDSGKFRVLSPF